MKASELPAVMIMWHAFCLLKRIMLISATPPPSTGDNVWVLVSTALVLMMCIPGLFLFYGGLVRSKNVLSIAAAEQLRLRSNPFHAYIVERILAAIAADLR